MAPMIPDNDSVYRDLFIAIGPAPTRPGSIRLSPQEAQAAKVALYDLSKGAANAEVRMLANVARVLLQRLRVELP